MENQWVNSNTGYTWVGQTYDSETIVTVTEYEYDEKGNVKKETVTETRTVRKPFSEQPIVTYQTNC